MKLVILDRDGVVNYDSEHYIKSPEEWIPIPGSLEAIATLNRKGYTVTIATNQSGIGRGFYNEMQLDAIHQKMQTILKVHQGRIDRVFYCPHLPTQACNCRKPAPGLLQQIAAHYQCDLNAVPFVGDSLRDIRAACAVGCQPVLVRTGNGAAVESLLKEIASHVWVYDDLAAFAESL
ncbi:MAG: D,D-heptose 1,7-bisphosphate phosphatase (D-glycero-D-manno-heptose 1,7-bisphosphate phosphatase) [uncultured bacterium]|nr:MAG: D,D-heptose 1,7-bisphosphate phosphatase (D-glycero-D-manno-heptose 1,7-bisphosphate phosphatase) [uncultured bacterium]OGT16405.1 MAG: D-glycero-beta-D-manno-heptose-1,7-bisphosphate 7-phosphatase [Gammaproteobacteria bacterium RIFCSPHIGHO2_02_FULL_38_33]OGT24561.1 MAG: D-glycero-beta-D-manno-heptose-1,7-bisphosphate 7-phosphatase [Gammaproteobacteria bacterium RIFCSPHIGHO2_12_38_15]OGT67620.1 MAG: D-glycero-beta-D-manno-heptose-1,7-bisphosphate 7-phosphatase [Gammaproteobacteria bacter